MAETNVESLLNRVREYLSEKSSEKIDGDINLISVLKMERDEVRTHSRIIYALLSPSSGHAMKDLYNGT